MQSGHEAGVWEIWTNDGISDRFTFKGSSVALDSAPAEDGGSIPPDSTPEPAAEEPAAKVEENAFAKVTHKRRR